VQHVFMLMLLKDKHCLVRADTVWSHGYMLNTTFVNQADMRVEPELNV